MPGLEADVDVVDVGGGPAEGAGGSGVVQARVDAAYRAKYGAHGAASMVTAEAVATTLRLDPAR